METTIVKVYLDTKPAISIPIGEADDLSARRRAIDHIRKDLDNYAVVTYRMHVINRRQYLFIFLEPIRTDFSVIVNNIFTGVYNETSQTTSRRAPNAHPLQSDQA